MEADHRSPQPLDYAPPPRRGGKWWIAPIVGVAVAVALLLAILGWVRPAAQIAAPASPPAVWRSQNRTGAPTAVGFAEQLLHSEDAELGEAQAAARKLLNDLLAGTQTEDEAANELAKKIKPYTSCWVVSQQRDGVAPPSWHFDGMLTGPDGNAAFGVALVKQQSGRWMMASFSGPDRQ